MRKTLGLLVLLAATAGAQQIDSTQIKAATNGGVGGNTSNQIVSLVPNLASAPSSPVTGMQYCNTSTTPCTMYQYNGSTWVTPYTGLATYAATAASFPSTPTTGQLFYSQTPAYLWVYDSAITGWRAFTPGGPASTGNISNEMCTGAVITPPTTGVTTTPSSSGGSMGAGIYYYAFTYVNSTGGETTGSNVVSCTVGGSGSGSCALSNISTGGSGTTARRIYRTAVGGGSSGTYYFLAALADNTTTTYSDTAASTTNGIRIPTSNYSGALPANWSVINVTAAGGGGAGCTASQTFGVEMNNTNTGSWATTLASDVAPILLRNISSYGSGNFTATVRITMIGFTSGVYNGTSSWGGWGIRVANTAASSHLALGSGNGTTGFTPPFSTSNRGRCEVMARATSGANSLLGDGEEGSPPIMAMPIYARFVYKNTTPTTSLSVCFGPDGVNYGACWPYAVGYTNVNTDSYYYYQLQSSPSYFEAFAANSGAYGSYIEFDQFNLWVN